MGGFISLLWAYIPNTELRNRNPSPPRPYTDEIGSLWKVIQMWQRTCPCECVCAHSGRSLRQSSSLCIWSRLNEAERLAVVRSICRAAEWWASHSAAVSQGGSTHIWGPYLPFARGLCPRVPALQKVTPHMLWVPSGRSSWPPRWLLMLPWKRWRNQPAHSLNTYVTLKSNLDEYANQNK